MSDRKLVTVRKITSIEPIKGADFIELAKVDGWQVVVKKNEFKEGDLCIYFEIDSYLPINPCYEFLRKSSYKKMGELEGFRLRTIEMKGHISQGLALPWLPEYGPIGSDITDLLSVVKYSRPIPKELEGIMVGDFPGFISKTDLDRLENISNEYCTSFFRKYSSIWVTEKINGVSFTAYVKSGKFGICSKDIELDPESASIYAKASKQLQVEKYLRQYQEEYRFDGIAIQGELVGPSLPVKNYYKLNSLKLFVFNIFELTEFGPRRLASTGRWQQMNSPINVAPLVAGEIPYDYNDLIANADGYSILNSDVLREGLVVVDSSLDERAFKVISRKYLLKGGD